MSKSTWTQCFSLDKRRQTLLVCVVVALASALRIAFLDQESFWLDESTTSYYARKPLASLIRGDVREAGFPNGQLIIAHLWIDIVGTSDFAMRLFPALIGILGVVAMYACGRLIGPQHTALGAAGLTAINPLHIHLSQEFRMYTPLFLAAAVMLWGAIAFRKTGSRRALCTWAIAAVLGMQFHYYAALSAVGLSLWMLGACREPRLRVAWAAANLLVALLSAPLIPHVMADLPAHAHPHAGATSGPHLVVMPLTMLFGRCLAWKHDGEAAIAAALLLSAAVWGGGFWHGWRTLPERSGLAVAALVPFGVALLLIMGWNVDAWDDRKALAIMPPLLLALAYGWGCAPTSLARLSLCTVLVFSGVSWQRYVTGTVRDDWRSAAAHLDAKMTPGDAVLIVPDESACALRRYLSASDPQRMYDDPIFGFSLEELKFVTYQASENALTQTAPHGLADAGRIWLVCDCGYIEKEDFYALVAKLGLRLTVGPHDEFARRLAIVECRVK